MENIGLICGRGQFPFILTQSAKKRGAKVYAAAHAGETDPALQDQVDGLIWIKVGQLQKIIDFFKTSGVTRAVMAGGLSKEAVMAEFEPDQRALALIARLTRFSDDIFLRALADELASDGIEIVAAHDLAPDLIARPGRYTQLGLTEEQERDAAMGWRVAKTLGGLDIGQSVVVKSGVVMAVEAVEGTDEAVRRGGRLARGGAVVVKVVKPGQDLRFDLPAVGLETIRVMEEVSAAALIIEAGRTLVFDAEAMTAAADEAGMAVQAWSDGEAEHA